MKWCWFFFCFLLCMCFCSFLLCVCFFVFVVACFEFWQGEWFVLGRGDVEGEGVCVLFRCVCFFQGGGGVCFFSFLGEGRRGVFWVEWERGGEGVICLCVCFFWERCVFFFGRGGWCVCGVLFGRDEGGGGSFIWE